MRLTRGRRANLPIRGPGAQHQIIPMTIAAEEEEEEDGTIETATIETVAAMIATVGETTETATIETAAEMILGMIATEEVDETVMMTEILAVEAVVEGMMLQNRRPLLPTTRERACKLSSWPLLELLAGQHSCPQEQRSLALQVVAAPQEAWIFFWEWMIRSQAPEPRSNSRHHSRLQGASISLEILELSIQHQRLRQWQQRTISGSTQVQPLRQRLAVAIGMRFSPAIRSVEEAAREVDSLVTPCPRR